MARTSIFAAVSLDGFIAADDDTVGPLFDWYQNGDVAGTFSDEDRVFHTTQATADFLQAFAPEHRRRASSDGASSTSPTAGTASRPTASTSSSSPTRSRPTGRYRDTAPFTFVTDGVAQRDRAGEGLRRRPRRLGQRRPDRRPGAPRGPHRLRRPQPRARRPRLRRAVLRRRAPWPTRCCSTTPASSRASRSPTWSTTSGGLTGQPQ